MALDIGQRRDEIAALSDAADSAEKHCSVHLWLRAVDRDGHMHYFSHSKAIFLEHVISCLILFLSATKNLSWQRIFLQFFCSILQNVSLSCNETRKLISLLFFQTLFSHNFVCPPTSMKFSSLIWKHISSPYVLLANPRWFSGRELSRLLFRNQAAIVCIRWWIWIIYSLSIDCWLLKRIYG